MPTRTLVYWPTRRSGRLRRKGGSTGTTTASILIGRETFRSAWTAPRPSHRPGRTVLPSRPCHNGARQRLAAKRSRLAAPERRSDRRRPLAHQVGAQVAEDPAAARPPALVVDRPL